VPRASIRTSNPSISFPAAQIVEPANAKNPLFRRIRADKDHVGQPKSARIHEIRGRLSYFIALIAAFDGAENSGGKITPLYQFCAPKFDFDNPNMGKFARDGK